MSETKKYTQETLRAGGYKGLAIATASPDGKKNKLIADLVPSHEEYSKIPLDEAQANAARIVQCWNSHDDLVEAVIRTQADLQYFVDRCEAGTARSATTQARYRETLEAIKPALSRAAGEGREG